MAEDPQASSAAPTRRDEALLGATSSALLQKPAGRRQFFSLLGLGWLAFTAGFVVLGTITARFFFPRVLFEPPSAFKAGFPTEYEVGAVSERYKDKFGVWIVRDQSSMYALSTICTHLGCTPNWLDGERKFKCPCHGSGFYPSGINFEGPAPRPLERYKITFAADGQIIVDKNSKYQFEKGQWSNPDSFLAV